MPAGVARIDVVDSLLHKSAGFGSGETTYQGIQSQVLEAADAGNTEIMFYLDSPGGEVAGLFETVSALQAYKKQYGLIYTGVVDTLAASACYAIAAVCDTVYATEHSQIGSIGAIITHWERTKKDKKEGVEYTIIRSRDQKAKGGIHEKLDSETVKAFEERLTLIDNQFTIHVTTSRNIQNSVIDGLSGRCVSAVEAKELGLIDAVIPYFDTDLIYNKQEISMSDKDIKLADVPPSVAAEISAKAVAAHKASAETEAAATEASNTLTSAVSSAQADAVKIVNLATEMKLPLSLATTAISSGQTFEAAKANFKFLSESRTSLEAIDQTDIIDPAPTESTTNAESAQAADNDKIDLGTV